MNYLVNTEIKGKDDKGDEVVSGHQLYLCNLPGVPVPLTKDQAAELAQELIQFKPEADQV